MRSPGDRRRRAATLLTMALLAAPLAAAAQDAAPANPPTEEDRPWWQSVTRGYTWLTDHGIYPDVGVVVAGSSLAFGGRFHDLHIAGSPVGVEIGGMWSLRGYQEYTLRLGLIDKLDETFSLQPADAKVSSQFNDLAMREPGWAVYAEAIERDYPRVNFYGIGPDVTLDDRTDYAVRGHSADLTIQYRSESHLAGSARVGVLGFEIGRGTNPDAPDLQDAYAPDELPGLATQPRFVTLGLAAAFDDRDSPVVPTTGSLVGASLWWLEPTDGEAFTTVRLTLDARTFVTPLSENGVLALRGVLSTKLNDDPTPFYLQHHLGGADALRGYPSYLFRGDAVGLMSIEYRWRVKGGVDLVPFVDLGVVGESIGRLRADGFAATPGIGIRVRNDERVWGRMDLAYRPGGMRVSFSLDPPF